MVYKGADSEEIADPDFEYLNKYVQDLRDAIAVANLAQIAYDQAKADLQKASDAYDAAVSALARAKSTLASALKDYYEIEKPYNYDLLNGGDGEHVRGSNKGLAFEINAELGKYECLLIDGEAVSADKYTVTEGSTVLNFSPAFLETYPNGSHTVTALFHDGISTSSFRITEKAAKPGEKKDNCTANTGVGDFAGYYVSFSLATVALAMLLKAKRKEEE